MDRPVTRSSGAASWKLTPHPASMGVAPVETAELRWTVERRRRRPGAAAFFPQISSVHACLIFTLISFCAPHTGRPTQIGFGFPPRSCLQQPPPAEPRAGPALDGFLWCSPRRRQGRGKVEMDEATAPPGGDGGGRGDLLPWPAGRG